MEQPRKELDQACFKNERQRINTELLQIKKGAELIGDRRLMDYVQREIDRTTQLLSARRSPKSDRYNNLVELMKLHPADIKAFVDKTPEGADLEDAIAKALGDRRQKTFALTADWIRLIQELERRDPDN